MFENQFGDIQISRAASLETGDIKAKHQIFEKGDSHMLYCYMEVYKEIAFERTLPCKIPMLSPIRVCRHVFEDARLLIQLRTGLGPVAAAIGFQVVIQFILRLCLLMTCFSSFWRSCKINSARCRVRAVWWDA